MSFLLIAANVYFSIIKSYLFIRKITKDIEEADEGESTSQKRVKKIKNIMWSLIFYPVVSGFVWIIYFVLQILTNYINGPDRIESLAESMEKGAGAWLIIIIICKSITAAQLSERNRIAREIHDNVGHMLSRSILQVGAMMVVHKDEPVGEELKMLRATLDTAMNNIRESVHDIRDEAISLSSALEEIVEPLKDSFKVSYEFDADEAEIPKDVKYAGINIVKEAVSNIIKYSRNECVDVRFIEHPSMYQIIVHDYKQSKDVSQRTVPVTDTSGEGMGLENIKTRAEKLGGNATFTNDNGFRVFVRIPKQNV